MQNLISTILVGVDFTEKSLNAVKMAAHMGTRHKAKIILFHNITNHSVIDRTGKQVIGAETINENYNKADQALKKLETSLKEEYPVPEFKIIIKNDTLIHGINTVIDSESVDLVICGTSGKQNFAQLILGSLSYQILTGADCSVLLVPENCSKYSFEKILVPVRVLEDLADKIDLSVAIAKKNKGVISLLGISTEEDLFKIKEAYQSVRTSLSIKAQEYDSRFLLTRDKATQISKLSQDDNADIIILNYKDEDGWKSFFLENFFKQIINHTDIPLFFLKNRRTKSNNNSDDNVGFDITMPCPG
ncbi:nucleotide-binding universal stress UspA family protein [Chryseobacterium ginsenosidimutans]|uniref:universal stress protein n=1 Tax=Chryseobacterium ginsenosidimutans TaxID=687846 RepID=UPI00278A17C2|nr:universal stress protein [Chryseobacterium ginsenosidimutans]MDQ0593497.1 nucleotide-binding universal stress UspA family protein [Chryseobacterium ginsenosidimutans]